MSLPMLERAARELEPFLDEVAFVGGATIALWITDPGAPAPRATKDVDVVVEVASRLAWHNFEERIRAHGLRHDTSSTVICSRSRFPPANASARFHLSTCWRPSWRHGTGEAGATTYAVTT